MIVHLLFTGGNYIPIKEVDLGERKVAIEVSPSQPPHEALLVAAFVLFRTCAVGTNNEGEGNYSCRWRVQVRVS